MNIFGIYIPVSLVLVATASLAYPSNTRSQSLTLTNVDASPGLISQAHLTNLGQGYPVYPTTCFPPPSRGPPASPLNLTKVLSDCCWIINELLLQQDGLLFQDLLFDHDSFKDQSGKRHLSRWSRGQCAINVVSVEKDQKQRLQLFTVVLAAIKILTDCIEDQRRPHGATTPIGSQSNSFHVGIQRTPDGDAAKESSIPLPNLDLSGRGKQRGLPRATSNEESSLRDYDDDDSTVSLPPSVRMEKRASDPQHSSRLSTGTESLVPGDDVSSTSNLVLPSTNLSGSVRVPPTYPVTCFNPYQSRLRPAAVEDCQFIINQIILRYPNPMFRQTFGYSASADIDLSQPQNEKWIVGRCVMFVRNLDKTRTDTFRMVDVAYTAHRILTKCVIEAKYPVGGTADVGTVGKDFYVGVGGITRPAGTNTTILPHSSDVDLAGDGIGTHGAL
ncbi:MAG: hypothetical protein ALECFALPRED_000776 [Alectoria fallacina]|uniref:Uncharacterized protein n=1 Tax=Alectoria fallacina TaxID=1903189 RepID=A0A8H3IH92_9LECA|nr:MAG: hypothetical protein ALECFALPRED_000776 [Alectoria fallacina]